MTLTDVVTETALSAGKPAGESEEGDFLQSEGYVVVKGGVDTAVCDELFAHVSAMTDEAAKQGRNDLFGNIQEADNRWDLKLDLCKPVVRALNQFGERCGPLLSSYMGSPAIKVVELAAITSDPGAVAQPVHADTMHGITRFLQSDIEMPSGPPGAGEVEEDEDATEDLTSVVRAVATETALICSALVALQDVEEDMGPTHVWPRTNTVEHHATLWGTSVGGKLSVPEADEAFKVEHRKMTLKKGDLVMYDSRTMHCGGANTSKDRRRSVLVISAMGPGLRPDGTTWTMLPSLRNRLTLPRLPMDLEKATAPTAAPGSVTLPPRVQGTVAGGVARQWEDEDPACGRKIPPLEEWEASVQCATCRQWRPCSAAEAPRFASEDRGFFCKMAGFVCTQPQGFTQEQIDAALS